VFGLVKPDRARLIHERRLARVAPLPPRRPDTIQRSTATRSAAVIEPPLVLPGASRSADLEDEHTEVVWSRPQVQCIAPADRTAALPPARGWGWL